MIILKKILPSVRNVESSAELLKKSTMVLSLYNVNVILGVKRGQTLVVCAYDEKIQIIRELFGSHVQTT